MANFRSAPIIESLLDTDFYKFTMGQFVYHRYPEIPVTYAFKNRTKYVLLKYRIDENELRAELDYARTLRFNNSELHYLRGTNEYGERMFKEDYLEFLKGFQLPEYELRIADSTYQIEFTGKWPEVMHWETFVLSIVNELYYRNFLRSMTKFEQEKIYAQGIVKLAEKICVLRKPYGGITFSDFGTRRRFSRQWHAQVVEMLAEELPGQFLGTSNVLLAMCAGVMPMGTCAHDLFMVMAGIMHESDEEIRNSHSRVYQEWWDEYGQGLSVALTDTYTSDFAFRTMTQDMAQRWKGLRQDSGDPVAYGVKALAWYKNHGVDPKDKLIVFSDGLDVGTMANLCLRFSPLVRCTFGWGTNLTNDVGFDPLSLVVKPIKANGNGVVKLSDNLAKATGTAEDIERFKKIFSYTNTYEKECVY